MTIRIEGGVALCYLDGQLIGAYKTNPEMMRADLNEDGTPKNPEKFRSTFDYFLRNRNRTLKD